MQNQAEKLNILMVTGESNQTIPLRTQLAEVYGEYFAKYGHKITVILYNSKAKGLRTFRWNGIDFYEVPLNKRLRRLRQLRKLLSQSNYDILQIRQCPIEGIFGLFLKKNRKPLLVYQYTWPGTGATGKDKGRYFTPSYWAWRITSFLEVKVMKKADLILPISGQMGEYLITRGVHRQRVLPFPDGVNPETFNSIISGEEIRAKFALGNSPVLIYQGTMAKIRRLEILIHSFSRVAKHQNKAKLLMVGEGEGREDLRKLAEGLGMGKNVIFTGRVAYEEVPKYVAASDIALCPVPPLYLYKLSSPLKLFEYMAMSKPVVANEEIPEQKVVVEESGGGILVPFTPEAFAIAIIDLLDNPEKIAEMGKRSREWVVKNRTYEILARKVEERYFQLLVDI